MDMLDQALDSSSQDKVEDSAPSDDAPLSEDGAVSVAVDPSLTHASLLDPNGGIQYQFKTENGQNTLTYRVVQVQQHETGDGTAVAVTTGAALVSQQVAQALISSNNPYQGANGSTSPTGTSEGQFYVMMSPQDVLSQQGQGQRTLAPRTHQFSPKLEGARTMRDEKRRATHNEVERRRRDKINNWIGKLSKIIPDCSMDSTKQGQQSKGGILAKACDYIGELRAGCARVPELTKELEQSKLENQVLHQQCEALKNQNKLLLSLLQQHGVNLEDFEILSS